ncbi:outer membrane beta-barrel protein [Mucilaginibacter sp. McL0603]|uniref:outer membrane beta-barrel protein n=1 Tax=Mucilaginibacter sp. McL0603 TaxID=3415670 RepID=UPI003CF1705F
MKKTIFLIAAFLLAAVVSQAQTEKGTQTLGLNLSFGYNKTSGVDINPYDGSVTNQNNKATGFSIGPDYSYFIADKLDIEASLSYNTNTYNYSYIPGYPQKQSNYSYGGIIYLRKYFMYNDKLGLRAGPYVGYTRGDSKNTNSGPNSIYDEDSKTDNYNAGAKLDLVYYPSKRLGFSATLANLSYTHSKTNSGTQGNSSTDNVSMMFVNNGLGISIFYVL